MRLLYDSNGMPRVIEGSDKGLLSALSLGPPFVGSGGVLADEQPAASVMNPAGGGISAWPSEDPSGHPAVAVREDFPAGGVQTALVGGGSGGAVSDLAVGRSGLGDGLVAFLQGPLGNAAVVAAQVTTPPAEFPITVPRGWVKPRQAVIGWAPSASASGPLSYAVVLDGHRLPAPPGATSMTLNPHGLGNGVHKVQVLATDIFGQSTLTSAFQLKVAGAPPSVKISAGRGLTLTVRVSDRDGPGVSTRRVRVSFGDGTQASARTVFHHRYTRAGVYTIVVDVADKLGNTGVVRRPVSVR